MRKSLGLLALSLAAASALTGCGQDRPPFDPQNIAKIQREQASGTPAQVLPRLPTTLPSMDDRTLAPAATRPSLRPYYTPPVVRMTLQEIVSRTVLNNLDTRVAGYQSAIDEVRILEAEARYDPRLFATFQHQRQFPQGLFPQDLDPREVYTQTLGGGLRQTLYSGGEIELRTQVQRAEFLRPGQVGGQFDNETERVHIFDPQVVFQITQPLLQGFGETTDRLRITVARNDQKISQLDAREQLERALQQLEQGYWDLVFSLRQVEILERLQRDTETTMDILIKRQRNDVTQLQVSQARSAVERTNADLVRARQRLEDLSDQIKRLMNDPDFPIAGPEMIMPADAPLEDPVQLNLADQVEAGLHNRLELAQQILRIDSARKTISVGRNLLLPRLDLQANVIFEGVGESFGDSLKSLDNNQLIGYGIGFQFEIPIGNRQSRALYQRLLLQHQQAIVEWQRQSDTVTTEVKQAMREIITQWNLIVATRQSRFAAEDALAAIENRERAGQALTAEFVQLKLDGQSAVASAQSAEAQAVRDYNTALALLERAKGTILRYNNVVMKEEPGPAFTKFATKPGR